MICFSFVLFSSQWDKYSFSYSTPHNDCIHFVHISEKPELTTEFFPVRRSYCSAVRHLLNISQLQKHQQDFDL